MRADIYLHTNGYADSRAKAKVLIESGVVYADGTLVSKPASEIDNATIEIRGEVIPYVSRGGLKLDAALDAYGISPNSMVCLDVGASTGGFTDCLLQHGATRVYAVDCGHGQLAHKLLTDDRVISIEGFNARELSKDIFDGLIDLCVMDVSFISQTLIHPALATVMPIGSHYISLIKPQFEVGRSNIGKNGIVKNEKARKESVIKVLDSAVGCGFMPIGLILSPIKGTDGNTEYIAYFRRVNSVGGYDKSLTDRL